MPTSVSVTYGGTVALIDTETGRRFDVAPEAAEEAAVRCAAAAAAGRSTILIASADGDGFRYDGDAAAMRQMADDLRGAAALARRYADRP